MEKGEKEKTGILIIGLGHHARRVYLPTLHAATKAYNLKLFGVDLLDSREVVEEFCIAKNINIGRYYLKKFNSFHEVPLEVENLLNKLVSNNNIKAVIISTDPLNHKAYAKWALSKRLHILMDKPITTRRNLHKSLVEAEGIVEDYHELVDLYREVSKKDNIVFLINTQRRYEPGFEFVFERLKETSLKFNIPITSIQAMHADGVWIFPNEIVNQEVHPYNKGYGKVSHSGFHILDIAWQFYLAGQLNSKFPDKVEVLTSFLKPLGLYEQFNKEDYVKLFGGDYITKKDLATDLLLQSYRECGENDAFSIIRLLKNNNNICNISINLLHNSFSRRSWLNSHTDLYKGNGRVKHQFYSIQQGPFQCINIHNYQSTDNHDINDTNEFELGGKNHFEIHVFKNASMFNKNTEALEVIHSKDLEKITSKTKLQNERVKEEIVLSFLEKVNSGSNGDLKSSINSYDVPVKLMSSIYKSNILYQKGKNPLVSFNLQK